jgi:short subunit dehydrogenase-like uncharacterized protein
MSTPKFDIVIYGATSFAGQIVTKYLMKTYGLNQTVSWAVAGRSIEKLTTVRDALGAGAENLLMIVADAEDEAALKSMCEQGKVVISTVGPYDLYGSTLIKACVETGTDYCDLTGEIRWVRRMVELYDAKARETGARIINSCGFDSLPSDMGVYFLQKKALEQYGEYCLRVKFRAKAADGAFSGGTVATMLNETKVLAANPALEQELADPYYICPAGYSNATPQYPVSQAQYDKDFDCWIAPFIMAAINEPVVFRSNALANDIYGDDFSYNEAMMTMPGFKGKMVAKLVSGVMKGFTGATKNTFMRGLLERHVLPAPGEGPSPEAQEKGFYDLRFFGETKQGKTLVVQVTGDRDPGYGSTAKMLSEAALALSQGISKQDQAGGFWTPATVFDQGLIDRLCDRAGMTFTVLD